MHMPCRKKEKHKKIDSIYLNVTKTHNIGFTFQNQIFFSIKFLNVHF